MKSPLKFPSENLASEPHVRLRLPVHSRFSEPYLEEPPRNATSRLRIIQQRSQPRRGRKALSSGGTVKELARFLLQNAQIDFSGEITIEQVRQFLRDDDSREARALLGRLIEDKGVDEMLVTVADCLKEHIPQGISEETVRQQLANYGES